MLLIEGIDSVIFILKIHMFYGWDFFSSLLVVFNVLLILIILILFYYIFFLAVISKKDVLHWRVSVVSLSYSYPLLQVVHICQTFC